MRILKDEAHVVCAEVRQLSFGGPLDARAEHRDRAGGRPIEPGHEV